MKEMLTTTELSIVIGGNDSSSKEKKGTYVNRALFLVCFLLLHHSIFAQEGLRVPASKNFLGIVVEHPNDLPLPGVLIQGIVGNDTVLTTTDHQGRFNFLLPDSDSIIVAGYYFGNQLFERYINQWDTSAATTFKVDISKQLPEVVVKGMMKIVHRGFNRDTIQVEGIEIFKNSNVSGILDMTPGVVGRSGSYTYHQKPIVGIRYGERGKLRPLSDEVLKELEGLYAHELRNLEFRQSSLYKGGVAYEMIVHFRPITGYSITPTIILEHTKEWNTTDFLSVRLNTQRLRNNLFLSYNNRDIWSSSNTKYTIEGVSPIEIDIKNQPSTHVLNIMNSTEYDISERFLLGVNVEHYYNASHNDVFSQENQIPVKYRENRRYNALMLSSYIDYVIGQKHKIHWEGSFNRMTQYSSKRRESTDLYHNYSTTYSPNTSLFYTYENSDIGLTIESKTAVGWLRLLERVDETPLDVLKEMTITQGISATKRLGKSWSVGVGLNAEYIHREGASRNLLWFPNAIIKYQDGQWLFAAEFSSFIRHPLSTLLGSTQSTIATNIYEKGNKALRAEKVYEIKVDMGWNDWFLSLSKNLRNDIQAMIPSISEEQSLLFRPENIGSRDVYDISIGYFFRSQHFGAKPFLKYRFGKFSPVIPLGEKLKQGFVEISTLVWFNYESHYFTIAPVYVGKYRNIFDVVEPMFTIDAEYSFRLLQDRLLVKLFASDIFNSNNEVLLSNVNGVRTDRRLLKGYQSFGVSFTYNFRSDKVTREKGWIRNNNTRH